MLAGSFFTAIMRGLRLHDAFIQKVAWSHVKRLGDLPQHEEGDVLHAAFNRADVSTIHAHAASHRFLA